MRTYKAFVAGNSTLGPRQQFIIEYRGRFYGPFDTAQEATQWCVSHAVDTYHRRIHAITKDVQNVIA